MAHTKPATATSRVQWTKKGQKFAKNLPTLYFSPFFLASFFVAVDNFHVLLSFATYWLDIIEFSPGTKFYYSCSNRAEHESIIIYHIKHIRRISFWVFNILPRFICISPQKDCESRTQPIGVMRSITATRHVAQAAYRKLSIFCEFVALLRFSLMIYECRFSRASRWGDHSFVGHTIYRWLYTYKIGSFLLLTINTFIYFLYMFLLLLFRQLDYRLKFFNFLQIDFISAQSFLNCQWLHNYNFRNSHS